MQALLRWPYSPCVQLHASTSVHTLEIPDTSNHTSIWTPENTAYKILTGLGSAVLAAAVPYSGKVTWISRKGQRSKKYMLHILTLVLLLTRSCKDFRLGVERHSRHACTLFFNPSSNCNKSLNQMSQCLFEGVGGNNPSNGYCRCRSMEYPAPSNTLF